jgi:hypothetical protein
MPAVPTPGMHVSNGGSLVWSPGLLTIRPTRAEQLLDLLCEDSRTRQVWVRGHVLINEK